MRRKRKSPSPKEGFKQMMVLLCPTPLLLRSIQSMQIANSIKDKNSLRCPVKTSWKKLKFKTLIGSTSTLLLLLGGINSKSDTKLPNKHNIMMRHKSDILANSLQPTTQSQRTHNYSNPISPMSGTQLRIT